MLLKIFERCIHKKGFGATVICARLQKAKSIGIPGLSAGYKHLQVAMLRAFNSEHLL